MLYKVHNDENLPVNDYAIQGTLCIITGNVNAM